MDTKRVSKYAGSFQRSVIYEPVEYPVLFWIICHSDEGRISPRFNEVPGADEQGV